MANEVEELLKFSKDITVFTNGKPLETNNLPKGVKVVKEKLKAVKGDDFVNALETEKNVYNTSAVFVAVGTANAADFAKKLGIVVENNNIMVDKNYMTNVDGLFAIGDCIGGFAQIAKAVSDGANVSLSVKKYIKDKKTSY